MGKRCFPLFVDLSGWPVVLFGGGRVACRRAQLLQSFGAQVRVIAPACRPELERLGIPIQRRAYQPGDCAGARLALAATDDRQVNHAIFLEARAAGIPVNVCDAPEECDFLFPAVAECPPLVAGLVSGGEDHRLVRRVAQKIREHLGEWMG